MTAPANSSAERSLTDRRSTRAIHAFVPLVDGNEVLARTESIIDVAVVDDVGNEAVIGCQRRTALNAQLDSVEGRLLSVPHPTTSRYSVEDSATRIGSAEHSTLRRPSLESMTETVDIRTDSRERRREQLFERLAEADVDDGVVVTTDRDVTPTLGQYRIEHDAAITWESERNGADDWTFHVTKTTDDVDGSHPDFDVRDLPPQRRHAVLTETFACLDPDDGFVLVNDHDPKPLFYELRSTHGDVVGWTYLNRDPDNWRVEIVKTGTSERDADETETDDTDTGNGAVDADGDDSPVAATFDVREIPKEDRHPTIHHRYGNLRAGETMAIVAPHEPKPLQREFQQRYGDAFDWTVRERDPGRCRVDVTKQPDASENEPDSTETGDDTGALEIQTELDVRTLPPAERHELIFASYENLQEGEGFVLVNDHDPKPLYHQFEAEAGPEFDWEYRLRDPGEFRVRIGKTEDATEETDSPTDSTAPF